MRREKKNTRPSHGEVVLLEPFDLAANGLGVRATPLQNEEGDPTEAEPEGDVDYADGPAKWVRGDCIPE